MTPDGRDDELAADEFAGVVAQLAAAIPPVAPPPGVKAALFALLSPTPDIRLPCGVAPTAASRHWEPTARECRSQKSWLNSKSRFRPELPPNSRAFWPIANA